jgi:hypothetical protein
MKTRIHAAAMGVLLAAAAAGQKTSSENQVRDRGQTRTQDETQTLDRGRLGRQEAMPSKPLTLHGILVDGSCMDRTAANLSRPPHPPVMPPAQGSAGSGSGGISASGIAVDGSTLERERSDVTIHQVPDLRSRISDSACSVTGNTFGYAILTDNGRLLVLDEGGNTLVGERVQSSRAGRAMLNGTGTPLKPRATIRGTIHGDRLIVSKILNLE